MLAGLTAGVALGPVPTALASDTDVVTDLARTAEAVPLVEQVSDLTPSDDRPKKYGVKYVSEISNGDDREGSQYLVERGPVYERENGEQ